MMREQIETECDHDHSIWECPDRLITRGTADGSRGYGLIIHDGGSSYVRIRFCPWCGTPV
jgi:hypothetical protein